MHETTLVKSLLQQVEAIRAEQNGASVAAIRIEIGPLAGVEPLLVRSAYSLLAVEFKMGSAQLVIDEVPLSAQCSSCGLVEVELSRIACPHCGSRDVRISSGDEVRLQSVTIVEADALEANR